MPEKIIEGLTGGCPSTPGKAMPASRKRGFLLSLVVLVVAFGVPLWNLAGFAAGSELFSYILLVPFISGYLIRQRQTGRPPAFEPAGGLAVGCWFAGTILLLAYWAGMRPHLKLMVDDYLAVMMGAFLLFFFGICSWFFGGQFLRTHAFALGFLVFLAPIPAAAISAIDTFLQYGSAVVAQSFFMLAGTPLVKDGLVFQLPSITIHIAPECSGIHSSLVLVLVSLVAGHLFLRRPRNRLIFVLAVIPLSLLRNGFRVFTIGELCVHIGPHMIDSPIHHRGGPLFFALSLIPLFLLLLFLQRSERTGERATIESQKNPNPQPLE